MKKEYGENYDIKDEFLVILPKQDYWYSLSFLCRCLIKALVYYSNKIIENDDNEIIHNLRVTLRRLLTLLQFNKDYLGRSVNFYIKNFSSIQKLTNKLRDYDVIIINKKEFENIVENDEVDHLNFIQGKRIIEFNNVVSYLKSGQYSDLIIEFENFIVSFEEKKKIGNVLEIISPLLIKSIYEFYKIDVLKLKTYSDKEIHKLRIKVKKLRYIIEFFVNFWNSNVYEKYIDLIKNFQDFLGSMTDLIFWMKFLKELPINIIHSRDDLFKKFNDKYNLLKNDLNIEFDIFIKTISKFLD